MNHRKKSLHLSAMLLAGATLFFGSCGPENIDDPTYFAEVNDNNSADDAADKMEASASDAMAEDPNKDKDVAAQPMGDMQPGMEQGAMPQAEAPASGPQGAVVAAAVVPPARVVQLPDAFVKLPSEFRANPPVVTHSGEQINFQRRVLHERDIHVAQPAIEEHLVTKNVHTHNQFHTNVINHPSFARNVSFAATASVSAEVLPTTVITTPPVHRVGVGIGIGFARPYCAPWLSGGYHRFCPGLWR